MHGINGGVRILCLSLRLFLSVSKNVVLVVTIALHYQIMA